MNKVIAMCSIAMLITGCTLPPLPGFGVAADRPSRYYSNGPYYGNDGSHYGNRPYYGNRSYYGDSPYYSDRAYDGDGPYYDDGQHYSDSPYYVKRAY